MHWSSTSFVTEEAPHLKEYLSLIGNPSPFTAVDPIGPDDALLVIDIQNTYMEVDPDPAEAERWACARWRMAYGSARALAESLWLNHDRSRAIGSRMDMRKRS